MIEIRYTVMKKILFACLSLFMASALYGQSGDAKAILDKMSETYKAMPGFEISFTQKLANGMDGEDSYTGDAAVAKEKFFVDFQGQLIFCDGPTLWTYIAEAQELTISNFEPDEQAINPANIYDIYKEGFEFEFVGEDEREGASVNVVKLISTDEDADFTTIIMYIGQQDSYLKAWDLIDYDGIPTSFVVTKFIPNRSFEDGFFKFNDSKYNVEYTTDLRN